MKADKAMTNAVDFSVITELAGDGASREQLQRLYRRYYWAGTYAGGRDVLEVGCGAGQGLGYLASTARSLVGSDISEFVLSAARRHYGSRIDIRCFDAAAIPLDACSLDLVIMFEAIYYLSDPVSFVCEAQRILRPGGVLLLSTANKDLFDFSPSPHSVRYYGVRELGEMLAAHGFTVEFFGDTDVERVSMRQRALRPVKQLATSFRLIPRSKRWKAILKRIVFGPIALLPPEVFPGQDAGAPLVPIPSDVADVRHKVICCEATRAP